MKKLLRIDLTNKQYRLVDVLPVYKNLGGRGLTSKIVSEEVPAKADPLGKENKLVFAPGILAATASPNNSRLSVGSKSPLTGGIKEANSGGAAAQKLARLGIQGIVVEGASPALTMVKVTKDGVTFISAKGFKGMGNYDLIDRLKADHGNNISIISIGPCGEKLLKAASVSVTSPDFKIRMASRGGMGAVMGSKNLKAIIIDDTSAPGVEVADAVKLKEAASDLTKGILTHPLMEGLKQLGTPLLVNMINGAGCLPTKNYGTVRRSGKDLWRVHGRNHGEKTQQPAGAPLHDGMHYQLFKCLH
jgi:aldehyde:ferredoxin oxidoreductase